MKSPLHTLAIVLSLCGSAFAGEPIAYILCGGSGPYVDHIGGVRCLEKWGNGTYPGLARWAIPTLKEQGIKRVWLHNPGGLWWKLPYDGDLTPAENKARAMDRWGITYQQARGMWPDQWELAKQHGAKWADDEMLHLFHLLLMEAGVEEVVYYFGEPAVASTDELRKAYLKPFVHFRGASLAFDHVSDVESFETCKPLFKWIKQQNSKARIYTEARPESDVPRRPYRRLVDGTIALERRDNQRPEMLANALEHWGETIVLPDPDGMVVPEDMTHLMRNWWKK